MPARQTMTAKARDEKPRAEMATIATAGKSLAPPAPMKPCARYALPALVLLLAACGQHPVPATAVGADGALHVPVDYQKTYQSLGAWAVAADEGQGSKELHVVYASPGAVEARRRDGDYPDGAVLVKEVYGAATAPMTTGTVSHADVLKGWFVMVRDRKNSHIGNKLWGEGWGWAWFAAGKPDTTTSTDYHTDCLTCHEPARNTKFIYEQGYPVLK